MIQIGAFQHIIEGVFWFGEMIAQNLAAHSPHLDLECRLVLPVFRLRFGIKQRLDIQFGQFAKQGAVCGELTLEQRRADCISLGNENASRNHTDLCDKPRIRHRHLGFEPKNSLTNNVFHRCVASHYWRYHGSDGVFARYRLSSGSDSARIVL